MKIVVIGGYGEMGKITVIDLVETCKNCEIIVAGRDKRKAESFAKSFKKKNVKGVQIDVNNHKQLLSILKNSDVVINSTQYYMNLKVMKAALDANVNYVDLGGLFHMTKKQLKLHKRFKRKNLIAILGCGATPGITNIMAAYGARFLDKIDSIHVQFADEDYTNYNMPFVVPYSMYTIFDEFMKKPAVFQNGRIKFVEPLSGMEEIKFPSPVDKAACFYTLHSEVATFPVAFKDKGIKNCSFKGGFDFDFVNKVKFLIDAGLASEKPIKFRDAEIVPRDFTVKILNQLIPSEKIKVNDIEFLRVELTGYSKNTKKRIVVYCKAVTNKKWNLSAGSWDTGVPPSIAAQMIINGQINQAGVLPPEMCINPEIFFKELAKRNMKVYSVFR
ncbi:MAG: saccharopine dehydrogenase NADP-binding domain-containing protein [Candidatus Aenigmarchaeota archaeon]|nr:saccharopine dehydrogenase NADP-binding domain-containing protein [Candidatus Aenigmarchaeota archaeon]